MASRCVVFSGEYLGSSGSAEYPNYQVAHPALAGDLRLGRHSAYLERFS